MSDALNDRVRTHFHHAAERFDLIYRQDKPFGDRLVDGLFRGVVQRRLALTLQLCGQVVGKRVLDVGCGSGRYGVELARRGAVVVGVDFAPAMVDLAERAAREAGVQERCRFVAADFLGWPEPGRFDICLATGFFDYQKDPAPFLERMRRLGPGLGIFSFPIRWRLRTPTRWLRLRLCGCPVYFYGRAQVRALVHSTGWGPPSIHRLSRDYLVEARSP
ncbi:MAG: methyltransferase domain-containing protein [Candidatus Latescibacterota bacterium]